MSLFSQTLVTVDFNIYTIFTLTCLAVICKQTSVGEDVGHSGKGGDGATSVCACNTSACLLFIESDF